MDRSRHGPARVVLSTFGSHGDVLPFIGIGAKLAARGHQVSVATTPDFEPHLARAGLGFHPLCGATQMDDLHRDPRLWHPTKGLRLMFDLAVKLAPSDLGVIRTELRRAAAEERPFVAVAGPLSFGARLARDGQRFPLITTYLAPFLMRSRRAPPELPGIGLPSWLPGPVVHGIQRVLEYAVVDPARLPALNDLRRTLALRPIRNLSDWLPSPDRLLLMTPAWFAAPQPDWLPQARLVDFPRADPFGDGDHLDRALRDFLASGAAPVVITNGSSMRHGRAFFDAAARACAEAGQRAVLVCGRPGQIAALRAPDRMIVRYAPFDALLRHARAVIHHGGIGTCANAFRAGIPQIVVPNGFDQGDNAARVEKLGLGLRLSHADLAASGAGALARILSDPSLSHTCAVARARCADTDGIDAACDLIEGMAAGAVPRPACVDRAVAEALPT